MKSRRQPFTFRIGCVGYFNYVVSKNGVDVVSVDVPTWKHAYEILVEGVTYDLTDYQVTLGLPSGPVTIVAPKLVDGVPGYHDWNNFSLLPRFSHICSGVALANDWSSRPSVLSSVRLTGGEVVGIPCKYSTKTIWSWKTQRGRTHRQPITHVFMYTTTVSTAVPVELVPRGSGETVRLKVGQSESDMPEIVLTGSPIGFGVKLSADEEERLDLGHLLGSLSLCNATSPSVIWHSKTARSSALKKKTPPFDDNPFGLVSVRRPTKVDCSPRVLFGPSK